jgi:ribosomal-protein-alanine N-acetyltransferase
MKLPTGVVVRRMTADDVAGVLELERSTDGAPHWTRAEYLACAEAAGDSALRRFGLVAEADGALVGFTVIRLVVISGESEAELESIVVVAKLRKQGIGAGLLAAAMDLARIEGSGRLDLEVRASNLGAIRLYARVGLAEIGRRRRYYSNPEDDAVLMQVTL